MESQHNRKPSEQPRPTDAPRPLKKRFHLVKLEERVTPKKHGHGGGTSNSGSASLFSSGSSVY